MEANNFKILTKIEVIFNDEKTRDISYNSYIPELSQIPRKRASLTIEKGKNSIIFNIEALDFTALRASASNIINFGSIMEKGLVLTKKTKI